MGFNTGGDHVTAMEFFNFQWNSSVQ